MVPRTADEVLWTMQSYFPHGMVTAAPYAGATQIPLEPEPIYARKKGARHEVIATYDAEFRAGFDRKITGWAIDFMRRSHEQGKPFYLYLPYPQTHIPTIPDPEYAGRTRHGNWADILTQMDDRQIDGMDMRGFLLGDAGESGREVVLCMNGNRPQAVKWRQWKAHLFQQDDFYSTWVPYSIPRLYNLEWDPREENQVDFPHAWVIHPMAAAAGAFLKSLVIEPPVKPGNLDPYTPPEPGQLVPREHLQIGPIVQFVTTLHHPGGQAGDVRQHQPEHGLSHASGS